ncbi:hypothetical protein CERSUDRAFT_92801 [Gelatoporia subvermispora B]|uniref:Uncharacterized protein n=1 Tax=Ceriporiopsis subvermispora (strain B) TaxID=914234 RepID=M2PQD8_CERS8|nr:hypothetical protein CERSUDRAFT_92801 [Gelatoporia subvermispora B]
MSTPITSKLLRDGTTYFTLLLILSIVNIVGVDTNVFSSAAALFKIPISSIVISHFLLDLRQLASFPEDKTTTRGSQYVTLQFASFVDNMGESLEHNSDYSRGEFMEVDKNDDITGNV